MIFIAGAGPGKPEKHMTIKPRHCVHCNNDALWILEKTRYYVSLFFIPVIPVKTQYMFYCSVCGHAQKLEKEEFERIVRFEAEPYQDEKTN